MAMIVDRKTGRKRKVNAKRSRIMKKAMRKRRHRKLKPAHIRKIKIALRKAHKSGRTKFGRKARFKRVGRRSKKR
jgi:hypothetical protein